MDPQVPLRSQDWKTQAVFVLKHGVLGWGVTAGTANFLYQSYKAGHWLSSADLALALAVFGVGGIAFGFLQMKTVKVTDPTPRCMECGEVLPGHTAWCDVSKKTTAL